MNKYLKVGLWVIVATALATGAYLAYQYLVKTPSQNRIPAGTVAGSPEGVQEISSGVVFDYWINKTTGSIYYLATDGQIYKTTGSAAPESLSSQATGDLNYLKPSFDGSLVMVGFGYPQRPTIAIYNPGTKSWMPVPNGAIAAAWDPKSNNRLIYLKDNGAANQLYYFTLADKKSKLITGFSGEDLDLDWAFADLIYLTERPSVQAPGSAWSYNLKTGAVQTIARGESGLTIKWNPGEKTGLRWSFGQLSLVDPDNKTLGNISLKTIPSKCAFSDIKIYCAAPSEQGGIATSDLSDRYLKGSASFIDDIYFVYKSGIGANIPAFLYTTAIGQDADHLEILNDKLIFISRKDQRIYSLPL